MKQVRKISNLVAEELQTVLESKGVNVSEDVFESRVTSIVDMLATAISEGVDCDKTEDEEVVEGVEVDEIYVATANVTLGDVEVAEGEFVEIDEIDLEDDTVAITVYDAEGEVKTEAVVSYEDIKAFEDSAEELEIDENGEILDDEEEIEEGIHIKGGKKIKVSAAVEKLKEKLKAKKGNGVNKFTIKNGKIVKKSADQLKADKKKSKVFAKQMKKFAKKRAKSLKKSMKLNSGAACGSKKVVEGFDIVADGLTFAAEAGDIISYADGKISVTRGDSQIISGLAVAESFMDKCVSEGVIAESEAEPEAGTKVDENAAVLSYNTSKGYTLVKEGAELALGNRIRARAYLTNEGYEVTSDILDKAVDGELVTL